MRGQPAHYGKSNKKGSDLFVEGGHVRIPHEGLGSFVQLLDPEAFADHDLSRDGLTWDKLIWDQLIRQE